MLNFDKPHYPIRIDNIENCSKFPHTGIQNVPKPGLLIDMELPNGQRYKKCPECGTEYILWEGYKY